MIVCYSQIRNLPFIHHQSFHKKGKRISDRATTNTSNPHNINISSVKPPCITDAKAILDIFIRISNCGINKGKPKIAISAVCC